jgi:hypothetical protein
MRRALFLGSPFFGYYRHIIGALEARGFEVDYYNDRPGENAFVKGAFRVRPSLVQRTVRNYLDTILESAREREYDLIFVVNGKAFDPAFIGELRRRNPRAEAVLYLWDSIQLYPQVLEFASLFDRRYTFDTADARAHPDLQLLPLFFTHDYQEVGDVASPNADFDVANVCTAHANRYGLMKTLIPELEAADLRIYSYLYLHPFQFLYNKLRVDAFEHTRPREFRFRPLSVDGYIDVLRRSSSVLDVSHTAQSGLTMRTIETVGARRKLITTNSEVLKYPFYHPTRVLVLDPNRTSVSTIRDFIRAPQEDILESTRELYSIDTWAQQIISGEVDAHASVLAE